MGTVHVMDHPLILHKLSLMRDSQTGVKEFREAIADYDEDRIRGLIGEANRIKKILR